MANVCPVCNNPVGPEDSACPHCGFKLQGSTQRFAPLQFGEDQLVAAAQTKPTAEPHGARGPHTGVAVKRADQKRSIGRSPQCDIFLNDMTVSRTHASVEPVDSGYEISDEASFNGVWVNNNIIDKNLLADGDVEQIGAYCLVNKEE